MRVLVLGSSGFLGGLVARELEQAGHAVERWSRSGGDGSRRVDLLDERAVADAAPAARPDALLLAAGPSVPARFGPREAEATERIARAALGLRARHAPGARIVALSSAHVLAPGPKALAADAPVRPAGEYGRARAHAERILLEREDVVVARLFGTLGPGLPAGLLVSDLAAALARGDARVEMAGPDVARDWMDGRDAARALRLLLEPRPAPPRIVHVGTGRAIRASDFAARLQCALGTAARVRFAPGDGPSWIADPSALATLRFAPQHDLDDTARWIAAARAPLRSGPEEPGAQGVHGGT